MKPEADRDILKHKLNQTSIPDVMEGWERMHHLLEARSANHKKRTILLVIKRLAVAAACLAVVIILGKQYFKKPVPGTIALKNAGRVPTIKNKPSTSEWPTATRPIHKPAPEKHSNQTAPPGGRPAERPSIPVSSGKSLLAATRVPAPNPQPLKTLPGKPVKTTASKKNLNIPAFISKQPSISGSYKKAYTEKLLTQIKQSKANTNHLVYPYKKPFHVSVRLKANGNSSFGEPQRNFNPLLKGTPVDIYPAVYVSKGITDKIGLQAGLAMISPVDISGGHLNSSVLNTNRSMVAQAVQSRDQYQISRLYYVDVPVTVQYHLSNRLTVGSGMQLSILEKVIGRHQRVDYGANYAVLYAAPSAPGPRNLSGNEDARHGINPLDLRWLGTLKYNISDRWMAAFQFQYGLLDISDNRAFLNKYRDHNVVLSAGVGFVIK